MRTLPHFIAGEAGTTAVEYGLMVACLSVAIVAAAHNVGTRLNTTFIHVEHGLGHDVLIQVSDEASPPREPLPPPVAVPVTVWP
jgi:Flp pilus assembly pilin Flp